MLLEVACFNIESARMAQKAGAGRIELCENYQEGGISPSPGLIKRVKKELSIPVVVMLRPRPGNFVYSGEEFEQMKKEALFCKEQNCDGLVFGILNSENKINTAQCRELAELAKPLPCTFHRAFDKISDSDEALEQLCALGFSRILTSGKAETAIDGATVIKDLIKKAKGRITILPGGGIRSVNASALIETTGAKEIHSAAITGKSEIASENEIKKILNSI